MRTMTARASARLAWAVIAAAIPAAVLAAPASPMAQAVPDPQPLQASVPEPNASEPALTQPAAQTLHALYGIASNTDGAYRAALAQVRASEAAVNQARATLLPRVAMQADIQRSRISGSSKEPFAVSGSGEPMYAAERSYTQRDAGISATQPLYRPANKIAWDQSKRQLGVAQAQLAAAQQDLIVRLAQAYFDVLAAQDTLRYLRTLKDSVSQQLAMARRNFDIGNANVTDSREAQARLAMTTAQEIAAENDGRVKQLALEQLIGQAGVRPRPLANPADLPTPRPQDANSWAEASTTQAPAVRLARLALEVAQLEVDKARAGHLPTLDLQASVVRAQYPNGNPAGSGAWSNNPLNPYQTTLATIGLQLSMPLYAGGAVLARQYEAQALQDKAQAQLDDALRGSAQTTRTAYFNLQSGLEQIKALQAAEDASRTALQANQLGYNVGARTNIDVLNAQSQLFQAQRDLAQARYSVLVGMLRLKQAAGVLAVSDLVPIDALLAR
jgi:outer membrane protein